jgi:pyruvate formate lyase activating enzyme
MNLNFSDTSETKRFEVNQKTVENELGSDTHVDSGWVFNIQKFSLHDGPGIRDLIFMKGCPLRCQWCSNPESQNTYPEIAFNPDRCIGFETCGLCKGICPQKAIAKGDTNRATIDRSRCDNCGACVKVCPDRALKTMGRQMTIAEILDCISADEGFHFRSGGGITVGGGDPIMQSDFVGALLKACRARGMDTAIETAGYGRWDRLEKLCRYANMVFYDIKSMDAARHKAFTGVSNQQILKNLSKLPHRFPGLPICVRTPVIPGFNDTETDISEIVEFLKTIETLKKYELLPYHQFGVSKYRQIGKTYSLPEISPPAQNCMRRLKVAASSHINV